MKSAHTLLALLDEAFVGLWRARRMTVVSILQIAVSLVLVGAFLLAAANLRGVISTVRDETAVTVFLKPTATEADRLDLERVARESRMVSQIRYVSADQARLRFAQSWRSLAAAANSLSGNPFPASLELDLTKDAVRSQALPAFLKNLSAHAAAEEIQFDVEWIRRLRGIVALVQAAGTAIGILLVLGAAFTIANVVRLTILLHRDEIDILRLVGAPEILIRGPFLLGGLLQGTLGGLIALGVLAGGFAALTRHVATTQNPLLGVFLVTFLPAAEAALLVVGGLVAGVLGGALAVRRRHL